MMNHQEYTGAGVVSWNKSFSLQWLMQVIRLIDQCAWYVGDLKIAYRIYHAMKIKTQIFNSYICIISFLPNMLIFLYSF